MQDPRHSRLYLPGLDGIRALSIIAVIWHHTRSGDAGWAIAGRGFLGVDAFFVLSGFLITSLLLHERERTGEISLGRFYMRRALRIFPLYYLVLGALALFCFVAPASSAQASLIRADLPWLASYTSNWVETQSFMNLSWSLSAEEQFYLLFPPLLALLSQRVVWPLVAALLANQLINFGHADGWLLDIGLDRSKLELLQITFTPMLLGVGLGLLMQPRLDAWREWADARPWWGDAMATALVAALLIAASVPGDIAGAPRLAVHLALTMLLAVLVVWPVAWWTRLLEWKPLVYIGSISYGMYLLHQVCRDASARVLARAGFAESAWLFALCLLSTIILASLSFRFFEQRWLKLKSRFAWHK